MGYWVALGFIFPFLFAYMFNRNNDTSFFSRIACSASWRCFLTFLSVFAPILLVLWLNFRPEFPQLAIFSASLGYSLVIALVVYTHNYKLNFRFMQNDTMPQYEKIERINFELTNWSILSGFISVAFILFCLYLYSNFFTIPKQYTIYSEEQLLLFQSFVIALFICIIFTIFVFIELYEKIQQIKNLPIFHGEYASRGPEPIGRESESPGIKINPKTLRLIVNVIGIAAIIVIFIYLYLQPSFPSFVALIVFLFSFIGFHVKIADKNKGTIEVDKMLQFNNIPYDQNNSFTGRQQLLGNLRAYLTSRKNSILKSVVFGQPGVGKTQLVLEYFFRYKYDYGVVWWVKSEKTDDLAKDYAKLAVSLELQEKDSKDRDLQIEAVRRWLEMNPGWLLIFDNADTPEELERYLPKTGSGNIIITSRNPNWRTSAWCMEVPEFERVESIDFLIHRTGENNRDSANDLAEAMGDLPLGLEQAGAYMEEAVISFEEFLARFQSRSVEIIKSGKPTAYEKTIATTYSISIEKAKSEVPESLDLLNLCAFLDPDQIPIALLTTGAGNLPEPLASAIKDQLKLDKAIASLRHYSLINVTRDVLSIHRLEQIAIKMHLSDEDKNKWQNAADCLMQCARRSNT
ncbi:MAG: FxSxx-COOH system tetratricopeptide repeat protein [Methanothrix sp.]|nr:FxSxx-COOH system tetratricopeptide repeat protein [Methanothrix sp.]